MLKSSQNYFLSSHFLHLHSNTETADENELQERPNAFNKHTFTKFLGMNYNFQRSLRLHRSQEENLEQEYRVIYHTQDKENWVKIFVVYEHIHFSMFQQVSSGKRMFNIYKS